MEIFRLMGSIFIDNEKANKSIDDTDKKGKSVGQTLGNGIKTAAKWGAAIVAGAAVAGGAMLAMTNKTSEAADRIDKLSQRLGMSRQGFQEWDFILSQNGVSIDSMQTGMKQLTANIAGVQSGAEKNISVFKRLDASIVDLIKSGASQEEVFKATIIAFQQMPDGVEKARLAQQLFGKQGQEMLPMLNASKGSVEELTQKARELGLVLGDEAIDAGVKYTDTMDQMKRMIGAVGVQVGAGLMPIMIHLMEWVMAHMPEIQAVMAVVFGVISAVVDKSYIVFNDYLLPVLTVLFTWIQTNMPTIRAVVTEVFTQVWNVVERVWNLFQTGVLPILRALWDFIEPHMPKIAAAVKGAFDIVIGIVNTTISVFEKLVGWVQKAVDWLGRFKNTDKNAATTSSSNFGVGGLKDIPGLATGGTVVRGGTVLVGEKGPELLELPTAAKVKPLNNKDAGGITQNINIYSPTPLTPSEVARKTKQASQQLAMDWGM